MAGRRVSMALLVAVSILAVLDVSTSSGAEFVYKYKEGGVVKELEAGTHFSLKAKVKKEYKITSKVVGLNAVVKCTEFSLSAANPISVISGGKPGTSEEQMIFSGCTASLGGEPCKSVRSFGEPGGEIVTHKLKDEIVTIVLPAAKVGELATVFRSEGELAEIKYNECGIFNSQAENLWGKFAAKNNPGGALGLVNVLAFEEPAEEITKIKRSTNDEENLGLSMSCRPATLNGESTLELVNGKEWGVF
jgi:hypothetical protein